MVKALDTCKTRNKNKQEHHKQSQKHKQPNTDRRQVSGEGETVGEKEVKRPKHSWVELHQEANEYRVSSSVMDVVNIP